VNLVLSAAPHSMVVERAVSHYNIFRNDKRLAMSLQTVNDRLLIALNGNDTGQFDPRPAVGNFLSSKHRRYRETKLETFSSRPFIKKVFFRTNCDSLIGSIGLNRPTLVVLNSEEIVAFLAKVCIFKKLL